MDKKQSWRKNVSADQHHYRVDWYNLSLSHYNKSKIKNGMIRAMKEEMGFSKYCAIYDIAMDIFCECGADINHEELIKHIEHIFGRDLYHYELVDYVQAINDFQE